MKTNTLTLLCAPILVLPFLWMNTALVAPPIRTTTVAGTQAAPWSPHHGPPPIRRFYGPDVNAQFLNFPDIFGRVSFYARKPELKVSWKSRSSAAYVQQKIALGYWPTWALTSSGGNQIIVGGKRRSNGHTVIERFTLGAPLEVFDIDNPDQGKLVPGRILGIESLYDDAHEGMDYVRSIVAVRSSQDHFLVRFDDSGDVFSFEWNAISAAWEHSLVASSASADPQVVTTPGLGLMTITAWTADHGTEGFVYFFGQSSTLKPHKTIVLSDIDRDGELDNAMTLTTDEWNGSTYSAEVNYLSFAK